MSQVAQAFEGRAVIVTGAGTGMGRAAALAFARQGAGVALAGRRQDELEGTAAAIRTDGGQALVVRTDVSHSEDVEALIAATVEHFGRLDAAFNNAGTEGAFAPISDLTPQQFDETMNVNLRGVWLCCKHELAAMQKLGNGGAIVNTSSWLAHGAFPGSSIYSASKAALDGMIRALALEVADQQIRINNVNPGIIDTPMLRRFGGEEEMRPFVTHSPTRRLGTPQDVADVVTWLCSSSAGFITGQNILVDGGYTIPGHRPWTTAPASSARADAG